MDGPEAEKLMAETFDKNMIDKDEYPATAAIEQRCVCMVADLFHAEDLRDDDPASAIGVSTIGSSEAVMLAGLALSWRWRERVGDGWRKRRPNLVMGSNVQVVWEKFCRYFDVEPRYLPMEKGRYVITPEQVLENVDEDTIGVVAILGTTFTGELEPIGDICAALDKLAADGGVDVPVHVDAASGGFVVPFLHPDLVWDFRLPRVVSINVSGHKYGLTYPGHRLRGVAQRRTPARGPGVPGELPRRRHADVHAELLPARAIRWSASTTTSCGWAAPGYTQVMECLSQTARWLGDQLRRERAFRGDLRRLGDPGGQLPAGRRSGLHRVRRLACVARLRLAGARLHHAGDATDIAVLRVVVREGFSADLARALRDDTITALAHLDELKPGGHFDDLQPFAH